MKGQRKCFLFLILNENTFLTNYWLLNQKLDELKKKITSDFFVRSHMGYFSKRANKKNTGKFLRGPGKQNSSKKIDF